MMMCRRDAKKRSSNGVPQLKGEDIDPPEDESIWVVITSNICMLST